MANFSERLEPCLEENQGWIECSAKQLRGSSEKQVLSPSCWPVQMMRKLREVQLSLQWCVVGIYRPSSWLMWPAFTSWWKSRTGGCLVDVSRGSEMPHAVGLWFESMLCQVFQRNLEQLENSLANPVHAWICPGVGQCRVNLWIYFICIFCLFCIA